MREGHRELTSEEKIIYHTKIEAFNERIPLLEYNLEDIDRQLTRGIDLAAKQKKAECRVQKRQLAAELLKLKTLLGEMESHIQHGVPQKQKCDLKEEE